jgi:hypothetical protein
MSGFLLLIGLFFFGGFCAYKKYMKKNKKKVSKSLEVQIKQLVTQNAPALGVGIGPVKIGDGIACSKKKDGAGIKGGRKKRDSKLKHAENLILAGVYCYRQVSLKKVVLSRMHPKSFLKVLTECPNPVYRGVAFTSKESEAYLVRVLRNYSNFKARAKSQYAGLVMHHAHLEAYFRLMHRLNLSVLKNLYNHQNMGIGANVT